jgi:hypothetical protein
MSSVAIVKGHNNIPVELEDIQPPLFALYAGTETLETEYHDYVERILDGNRQWVEIGMPFVRWLFFRLTREEFTLLQNYEGEVSIRTLDQRDNTYRYYNGIAKPPEPNGNTADWAADALQGWIDVVFEIYDLVEFTP